MKPPDDSDRAQAGTLPADPSADTVKAAPLRVVAPNERRSPDEPCDLAAERALLGALLWAGAHQQDTLRVQSVRDILDSGEPFYNRRAGAAFDAIRAAADEKQEHDPVAVYGQIIKRGKGGPSLDDLWKLVDDASTVSERQARVYAQSIRDTWARRVVIRDARALIEEARNGTRPSSEILAKAQSVAKAFADSSRSSAGIVSVKESAVALFTELEKPNSAIPTGLVDLDEALNGGLRPGEVSIVAARTNVGKSLLSMGIANHMASLGRGIGVLYVTLEMQHTSFTARMISASAAVSMGAIRRVCLNPSQWQRVTEATAEAAKKDIFFADNSSQTMSSVYSSALECSRRLARDGKRLGLVVVDHIGLVKPSAEAMKRANREQQVAETSRALRYIAQEVGCHVLGIAQIGRAFEKDGGERMPKLHHLRESGSIENDADVVMILHRERDAKTGLFTNDKPPALAIAKGRMDETAVMLLGFDSEHVRFMNWQGQERYSDFYGERTKSKDRSGPSQ